MPCGGGGGEGRDRMLSCRNDSGGGISGLPVGRLLILAGFVLATLPGVGWAQARGRPRAGGPGYMPSLSGPSQELQQGFGGRYGASPSYMRTRTAADVAMASPGGVSSSSGGGSSRRGAGGRAGGFDLSSFASGTQLLSRSSGSGLDASYSRHARPGQLLSRVGLLASDGYMPVQGMNREAMDFTRNRLASWGSPEIVAKRSETSLAQTQPAGAPGVSAAAPKVTLQQLVKNSLAGGPFTRPEPWTRSRRASITRRATSWCWRMRPRSRSQINAYTSSCCSAICLLPPNSIRKH